MPHNSLGGPCARRLSASFFERQSLLELSVPSSVPASVLARVSSVCTACVIGSSVVAGRKFLIAPFQAQGDERVSRPARRLGKKPLGRRPGVLQGLRLRRRRDLGLRRKHAQAQGARHGASEQEKVLHRDCPRSSGSQGYHGRLDVTWPISCRRPAAITPLDGTATSPRPRVLSRRDSTLGGLK